MLPLLIALFLGGCGATAAGEVNSAPTAAPSSDFSEADVRFVRHMITHHQQALTMTDLVPERTDADDIRLLAQRIDLSQVDEIAMLRRWLEDRGLSAAAEDPAVHEDAHMPGMLSEAELQELAATEGAEFERLFLEYMIRHHQGALVMVEELFADAEGAQQAEIYQIASHVDSDQRIEIARMARMLAERRR